MCQRTTVPVYRYLVGSADSVTVHGEGGYCHSTPSPAFLTRDRGRPNTHIYTCGQTPSTTSISTIAPSHSRTAVDTSLEKSMCPGESIMLIKYSSPPSTDQHYKNQCTIMYSWLLFNGIQDYVFLVTVQWHLKDSSHEPFLPICRQTT